tara:strand:- start:226 stop:432 length:207 start_codon:yes stop_codon:yes gene_type:complete
MSKSFSLHHTPSLCPEARLINDRLYDIIGSARKSAGFVPTVHYSHGAKVEEKSESGISVAQVEGKTDV